MRIFCENLSADAEFAEATLENFELMERPYLAK